LKLQRSSVVALVILCSSLAFVVGAWSLPAGKSSLNLTLAGSVNGASVAGKVQFGTVMCAPLSGKGLQVNWNGSAKTGSKTQQVSGSFQFSTTGKSSFGPHGTATATLVIAGNYSGSFASGVPGGGGTGTVAANRKSGNADVTVASGSSKVRENGNWVCG
jgi:hypothetical protein